MGTIESQPRKEEGFVLPLSLILLCILVLLGASGALFTNTDTRISANYRSTTVAFAAAEAGLEEARERLRANAPTPIAIPSTPNTTWNAYIGTATRAASLGYSTANTSHVLTPSLQTAMNYTASVRFQTNSANQLLLWGDANGDGVSERNTTVGMNILLITSNGVSQNAQKTLQIEVTPVMPAAPVSALYVKAPTTIQGTSTFINGVDSCGGAAIPGVMTTLPNSGNNIRENGSPDIDGNPPISYNGQNLNMQEMINAMKGSANFSYNQSGTISGPSISDNWGDPVDGATQQSPMTCSSYNLVYYNTNNSSVRFSGGVDGCGILMIDGDLEISGGFRWYGMVLTSGTLFFTGSGEKNVTGAVMAGGSVVGDTNVVGGGINILNCISAYQATNIPLRVLTWLEGI